MPSRLGTASVDTTCTIWDIERRVVEKQLIAHDKEVYDIAWGEKGIFATEVTIHQCSPLCTVTRLPSPKISRLSSSYRPTRPQHPTQKNFIRFSLTGVSKFNKIHIPATQSRTGRYNSGSLDDHLFVNFSMVLVSSVVQFFFIFNNRPTHLWKSEEDGKQNNLPPMEMDRMG